MTRGRLQQNGRVSTRGTEIKERYDRSRRRRTGKRKLGNTKPSLSAGRREGDITVYGKFCYQFSAALSLVHYFNYSLSSFSHRIFFKKCNKIVFDEFINFWHYILYILCVIWAFLWKISNNSSEVDKKYFGEHTSFDSLGYSVNKLAWVQSKFDYARFLKIYILQI